MGRNILYIDDNYVIQNNMMNIIRYQHNKSKMQLLLLDLIAMLLLHVRNGHHCNCYCCLLVTRIDI